MWGREEQQEGEKEMIYPNPRICLLKDFCSYHEGRNLRMSQLGSKSRDKHVLPKQKSVCQGIVYIPVISELRRLRQEDSLFKASLGYIAKLYLKKKK